MVLYTVNRKAFSVPSQYQVLQADGFGAFGDSVRVIEAETCSVCPQQDEQGGKTKAVVKGGGAAAQAAAKANENTKYYIIRKFSNITQSREDLAIVLRAALLQRSLGATHFGILPMVDLYTDRQTPSHVYAVYPAMECTLAEAIYSTTPLTGEQVLAIITEIALCLRQLHGNGIILGELRPEWIMINTALNTRGCVSISNLTSAHASGEKLSSLHANPTDLLWYRSPEFALKGVDKLTPAADMWSFGCIIAEMLLRRPLFQCSSVSEYFSVLTDALGHPPSLGTYFTNEATIQYCNGFPSKVPVTFAAILPGVERQIQNLLRKMLVWNPKERLTAEDFLQLPMILGSQLVDPEEAQLQKAKKYGGSTASTQQQNNPGSPTSNESMLYTVVKNGYLQPVTMMDTTMWKSISATKTPLPELLTQLEQLATLF